MSSPTNTATVTCSQIEAPQISILIWCLKTSLLPLVPHQSSRSLSLSLCDQEHIDIVSLIHKGNQLSIQQQHLSHILYLLLKFVQCRSSNVLPVCQSPSKTVYGKQTSTTTASPSAYAYFLPQIRVLLNALRFREEKESGIIYTPAGYKAMELLDKYKKHPVNSNASLSSHSLPPSLPPSLTHHDHNARDCEISKRTRQLLHGIRPVG